MNRRPYSSIGITAAVVVLLTTFSPSVFSQPFVQYNLAGNQGASLNFNLEPAEREVEGSPYYQDEWKSGAIYNKDNTFAKLGEMKYNLCLDELVFKYQGQQYLVPGKTSIKRFELGDEEFVGAYDGKTYSFYKVYESGTALMLLKHYGCKIKKGEPSKGYVPATNDQYVVREDWYVLRPGQNVFEINPKKGSEILNYLHPRRAEMEDYIKSSKLRMKREEDLVQFVRHYNATYGKEAGD